MCLFIDLLFLTIVVTLFANRLLRLLQVILHDVFFLRKDFWNELL